MLQRLAKAIRPMLIWIAGNLLGMAGLYAIALAVPFFRSVDSVLASFLFISVPIGLAQWLALRRLMPLSPLWMIAMPFGFMLSYLILSNIPDAFWQIVDDEGTATLTTIYTAIGAIIGLAQWVVLRRHLMNSSIWILSSAVGIGLGFGIVLVTDLVHQSGFLSVIVVILVYGSATGSILSLLKHPFRSQTLLSSAP